MKAGDAMWIVFISVLAGLTADRVFGHVVWVWFAMALIVGSILNGIHNHSVKKRNAMVREIINSNLDKIYNKKETSERSTDNTRPV